MKNVEKSNVVRSAFIKGYRVDDNGQVISPSGKVRKTTVSKYGYLRFSFKDELGKHHILFAHRLAAYQWFGELAVSSELEVRHINGFRKDNRKSNLALGTASQNMMDKSVEARVAQARYAASKLRRFTDEQIAIIRAKRAAGCKLIDIANEFGTAKSTISYIINHATY